jgi:hypothetical protein
MDHGGGPIVRPAWESIQLAKLPETRLSLLTGVAADRVLTQATQATQLLRQPSYPATQLPRSPALSAAREAAPIGLRAAVLRFRFGRIEVTTPFVEFVPEGVDALSMIRRAETLLFAHLQRS